MRPLLIGGDRAGSPPEYNVHPRDPQWPLNVNSDLRPHCAKYQSFPERWRMDQADRGCVKTLIGLKSR